MTGRLSVVRPREPRLHSRPQELRVLLTTEGTYPYAIGGVSSWCDMLVKCLTDVRWEVLPIVAGGQRRVARFDLPAHAVLAEPIELWSEQIPRSRVKRRAGGHAEVRTELPGVLVRELIGWNGRLDSLQEALVWCRLRPAAIRGVFRSRAGWEAFLRGLGEVLAERADGAAAPPDFDVREAARLYQVLYWVARTAAVPTPPVDVVHATAAGWAVLPALVDKVLRGTPLLLTEHGVYVREAYLASARAPQVSAPARFAATRLARGLARMAYEAADVISPVIDANARWEEGLGVDPAKIQVIYNGVEVRNPPTSPPRTKTIVSVGRIDPLKDVHTMMRVMVEVLRRVPDARFLHYGPVTEGQEIYGRAVLAHHQRLGLGDRFRFMGHTPDPNGAVQAADVVLMTSISEALPMSILEAMGQARPVVTTGVGGVRDVVRGCGFVARPGDVNELALGVTTLLRSPALAQTLGLRGYARLRSKFDQGACVHGYRDLLARLGSRRKAA